MKKTLITLLSLAGVAVAGVDGDWAGNFSWGAGETTLAFTFDESAPITLSNLSSTAGYKSVADQPNTYTPDANVGTGTPWTLSFELTNNSSEALDVRAITLNLFLFNGGGGLQDPNDGKDRTVIFSLAPADSETTYFEHTFGFVGQCDNYNGESKNGHITLDLGENYVALQAGQSIVLEMTASKGGNNGGTYVGLKGATFSIIPEPATATLSLLALCGLAARRRRK